MPTCRTQPTIFNEITRLKRLQVPSSAFYSASRRGIPLPAKDSPAPGAHAASRWVWARLNRSRVREGRRL
jgi:hypothetical protein